MKNSLVALFKQHIHPKLYLLAQIFPIRNRQVESVRNRVDARGIIYTYDTANAKFQARMFTKIVENLGLNLIYLKPKDFNGVKTSNSTKLIPVKNLSYSRRLRSLVELFPNDKILLRGVLDSYRRKCEVEEILGTAPLPKEFLKKIQLDFCKIEEKIADKNFAVVSDAAYHINSKIISHMNRNGKRTLAISPNVGLNEVRSNERYVTTDFLDYDLMSVVTELRNMPTGQNLISYILDALDNERNRKCEIKEKSQREKLSTFRHARQVINKKVLFLHSMRDASYSLPKVEDRQHPLDFIEWANDCLSVVAKSPTDWIIKAHPFMKLYEGDREILDGLLKRHNLGNENVNFSGDSIEFIGNGNVIFTHSGTIGFESAFRGWKVHSLKGRFNNSIAVEHENMQSYKASMHEKRTNLMFECDEETKVAAGLHLFLTSKRFLSAFKGLYPKFIENPHHGMNFSEIAELTLNTIFYITYSISNPTAKRFQRLRSHPSLFTSSADFNAQQYARFILDLKELI